MKQLLSLSLFLFLFLVPCLALAQYPTNGNQKITLGEQSTADGLIWRGVASIDTVTATSKITRVNKQDTSAFLLLDTVTNLLWHYKTASNGWSQAGGSTFDTTTLNLVSRFGLKLNISDTTSMLTNYYRGGRTGIIQASDVPTLNQNTTGSAATLTTSRTFQTNLASTSTASFNGSANVTPGVTGILPVANGGTNRTTMPNGYVLHGDGTSVDTSIGLFYDRTYNALGIGTTIPNSFAKLTVLGGSAHYDRNVSGGVPQLLMSMGASSGSNFGQLSNIGIRWSLGYGPTTTTLGTEVLTWNSSGNVGIGTASPQSGYRLHVVDSVYVGGNVSASAYTTRSDYNLKDDIFDLKYGLNDILKLQPVEYTYKSNGSKQLGFIAQDIGTILPEVVSFEESMSVNYQAIIPILTKAIQEQQALIKALEQRIINLENK